MADENERPTSPATPLALKAETSESGHHLRVRPEDLHEFNARLLASHLQGMQQQIDELRLRVADLEVRLAERDGGVFETVQHAGHDPRRD